MLLTSTCRNDRMTDFCHSFRTSLSLENALDKTPLNADKFMLTSSGIIDM